MDIGAAEGIFALDTIDLTKEVYLFEYEDFWKEPLEATFSPWREKVHIVKKYVGDNDLGVNISLNTFCKEKDTSDYFIKMDIEGAEMQALKGAEQILMYSKPRLAICTYHRQNDAKEISSYLIGLGYSLSFTKGYILWENSLRKVLVRA